MALAGRDCSARSSPCFIRSAMVFVVFFGEPKVAEFEHARGSPAQDSRSSSWRRSRSSPASSRSPDCWATSRSFRTSCVPFSSREGRAGPPPEKRRLEFVCGGVRSSRALLAYLIVSAVAPDGCAASAPRPGARDGSSWRDGDSTGSTTGCWSGRLSGLARLNSDDFIDLPISGLAALGRASHSAAQPDQTGRLRWYVAASGRSARSSFWPWWFFYDSVLAHRRSRLGGRCSPGRRDAAGRPGRAWIALAGLGLDSSPRRSVSGSAGARNSAVGPAPRWVIELERPWIPRFGIGFHLGARRAEPASDRPDRLHRAFSSVLASWTEIKSGSGFFHFNLLWVLAGIIGVFLALDLFLFYFFWELMLVPMYFLIGIWGHENRIYAAIKFFIFTQAGGLLMLVSILALYFIHGQATGVYTFEYERAPRHGAPARGRAPG